MYIYCFYMTDNRTIIISTNEIENSEIDNCKDYDKEVIDVSVECSKYNKVITNLLLSFDTFSIINYGFYHFCIINVELYNTFYFVY